ncbi:MAG: 4Fe-4S binding protein [Clostridia bacterium]|nr:4Fe-4S binding protein [Clostridia bacterium]
MRNFGKKLKALLPTRRRIIQLYAALLTNANLKGFASGRIYQGNSKYLCVPGLNCYSCPGAVGACPLGSLQNALAASKTRLPAYIFGILILMGLALGRTICGFLCPFGLVQDLLYKIPSPKLKKNRVTRILSYGKYVTLAIFVVLMSFLFASPAFCKYICPAGTLGGAMGLLFHKDNVAFVEILGGLFTWKFALMVAILTACVFIFRPFCRFLCPLGAIYGFFSKLALIGVKLDKKACTNCGLCVAACKMDIRQVGDRECINCGECIPVCPTKAISWKGSQFFLHKNEVSLAEEVTEAPNLIAIANGERPPLAGGDLLPQTAQEILRYKKRRKILSAVAWITATVFLFGALYYFNFVKKEKPPVTVGNAVGEECIDFTVPLYLRENGFTLGEEAFTLSQNRGKVTVINFWYTSCTGCKAEMPHFNKVAQEYDNVTFIAIHGNFLLDTVENHLNTYKDEHGTAWSDYAIAFAKDAGVTVNGETMDLYDALGGGNAWPYTLIVDAEGIIAFKTLKELSEVELRTELDKALQK